MIARRLPSRKDGGDSFRALARYLAAARERGERLDRLWQVNTSAADLAEDLELAIHEIEATQALNIRIRSDRNYHLVIAFRDERPSPAACRDIERHFAEALGFGEHQRIAATHENTGNYHMHVAINRIHPVTGKGHWPEHDFRTLELACREMEEKHGLKVDRGRSDAQERKRQPIAARDLEARTWERSFYTHVREQHREGLRQALESARNWNELHRAFGERDLNFKVRGAGLAIVSAGGKHHLKASALGRAFSRAALEDRFGPFQADRGEEKKLSNAPTLAYRRGPLTRHRGQGRLWRRYLRARSGRGTTKSAANWRGFLVQEAVNDPLAAAIIRANGLLAGAVLGEGRPVRPGPQAAPIRADGPTEHAPETARRPAIWLEVPFAEKNRAKALGARWSAKGKAWYVPHALDPEPFERWRPGPEKTPRAARSRADGPAERAPAATRRPAIWLEVPFAEKNRAKALGARWSAKGKAWYVPHALDPEPFERWRPGPEKTPRAARSRADGPAERAPAATRRPAIWLEVPFAEKNRAKALGARWSAKGKAWYVPHALDPEPFERWRPGPEKTPRAGRQEAHRPVRAGRARPAGPARSPEPDRDMGLEQ